MSVSVLISAACLIICIGAFAYFKSYITKRTGSDAILADIREEINRLLIRMDETTGRDISLIEDKEQSLKNLLEETDRRLKVYARELDRSLINERTYRELGKSVPVFSETVELEEPAAVVEEAEPEAPPSINEQIRALANAGFSSTIIASKLGRSISEVDLALAVLVRKPLV